jgi:hypothetical protein
MNERQMSRPAPPGSPEKKQESRDAQKVLRLLAGMLKPFGFQRTKPTFFTRPGTYVIEFVHVHKYTFAASFRVHFGVRVRSDEFPAAGLNGPCTDGIPDPDAPGRRLHAFDFTADEVSWKRCAELMLQCITNEGLSWFASIANPTALLSPGSPLTRNAQLALQREVESPNCVQVSAATQRALNAA